MNSFWNDRYSEPEYAYGKDANVFFKEQLKGLTPGRILLPAEGEGRNAVYAATLGWEVYAFDASESAMEKALKLASKNDVEIFYQVASFEEAKYELNFFDVIVLVYAHHPKINAYHKNLLPYLKPKGIVILEGFEKAQIELSSGGPKNVELLFSEAEINQDFESLSQRRTWCEKINLSEGIYHSGTASVIRMVGTK